MYGYVECKFNQLNQSVLRGNCHLICLKAHLQRHLVPDHAHTCETQVLSFLPPTRFCRFGACFNESVMRTISHALPSHLLSEFSPNFISKSRIFALPKLTKLLPELRCLCLVYTCTVVAHNLCTCTTVAICTEIHCFVRMVDRCRIKS